MQNIAYRLILADESDVGVARRRARELGEQQGLLANAVEALATAVSEIARNVIVHAGRGIPSLEDAMRDGYSTGNGLGLGLPGAQRLVDEFEIRSIVGEGTTVTLRKWASLPR
jgi:serine/threonine-protein kinase RsbT